MFRNTIILLSLGALCATSHAAAAADASPLAASQPKPNVLIIYGDDVGYGDIGAYGSTMIPTPNIDRLAASGVRFTDGHCAAGTCTPSRYSLLTGIHGFRHGVRILPPKAHLIIPPDTPTLPDLFKDAGYRTGIVGKWHLGLGAKNQEVDWNAAVKPGPLELGFDESFLIPSTNDRVPCVYLRDHYVQNLDPADPLLVGNTLAQVQREGSTQYPDGKTDRAAMTYYKSTYGHNNSVINGIGRIGYMAGGKSALWNDETISDTLLAEAKTFITNHKDRPFFLYFASQEVHVPRAPNPRFQGATELGYRGDAMVEFDWVTGQLLDELDRHGLTENTIVIFSSDNGPVYDDGYEDGTTIKLSNAESDRGHDGSGIYRGGKYQIYEGGPRVPFIISWPSHIQPGTSDALVNQIDLYHSLAKLLEIDLAHDEAPDSRDTLDAFLGKDEQGLPYMIEEAQQAVALREGPWKYVASRQKRKTQVPAELYNLEDDPSEARNIIEQNAEVATRLAQKLERLQAADRLR